jgi:hypothetical protein
MLSLFSAGPGFAGPIQISWTNNLLTLSSDKFPGGKVEVWYLEAFLRPGANGRDWRQSVLPQKTVLTSSRPDGTRLEFLTTVATNIEVRHVITSTDDELDIRFDLTNHGPIASDLQWFQPACIRVAEFTGRGQQDFINRTFIYTTNGLCTLDKTGRTTNALYLGGQVFPMNSVESRDANPRPIARLRPANGLIGCFSADDRWILATASDRTHELFEGVYVCIHSDPAVNGLAAGETKRVRQKIYLVPNDTGKLLRRYQSDFPEGR